MKSTKAQHPVLERQIKKFFGTSQAIPKNILSFLEAVNDMYLHNDEDRTLLERSLDISSKEQFENNRRLHEEKNHLQEQADQLQQINNLMINRELKMIELKQEISSYKAIKSKE